MTTEAAPATPAHPRMTVRGATIIGVGSMVGAGIFALLGEAGAIAGSATWISFLLAGIIAMLQGYSFSRLGSRFPSPSGLIEYFIQGFGNGHITGSFSWLIFVVNAIITTLVAISFGEYANALFFREGGSPATVKLLTVAVIVVLAIVNAVGVSAVVRVQGAIVLPVVAILTGFAVLGLLQINPALLAPSTYPPFNQVFASIGLTFFAFLGFGIMTFTAGDLENPKRDLPRAMFAALGIATAIYVALSLSVFGTLTPEEVVAAGPLAIAVAAEPILGQLGFVLVVITATMATAGCVNSGLYPSNGFSRDLVAKGQFPPIIGRQVMNGTVGLLVTAVLALVMAVLFDLSAVANMGSAVALLVFFVISIAHLRVIKETGANRAIIIVSAVVTGGAFLFFMATTVASDPATLVWTIVFILGSIAIDFLWKRMKRPDAEPVAG